MIDKKKVLKSVEEKYAIYMARITRSVSTPQGLPQEAKVLIDVLVDAFNEEIAKG